MRCRVSLELELNLDLLLLFFYLFCTQEFTLIWEIDFQKEIFDWFGTRNFAIAQQSIVWIYIKTRSSNLIPILQNLVMPIGPMDTSN